MLVNNEIKKYLSGLGKKGGKKTSEKGVDYYKKISKIGNKKRWENRKKG